MKQTVLALGGVTYVLAPNASSAAIKQDVLDAVSRGGGFVDIPVPGDEIVSVLVTSATLVILSESIVHDSDPLNHHGTDVDVVDNALFDDFLTYDSLSPAP
jgi:hypothetical protein